MSPLPSPDVGTDSLLGTCAGCRISLRTDTNPLLLPCLHSMCSNCMPSPNHELAVCPLCGMLYAPKNVTPNPLFCDVSSLSSSQKCGGCAAPAVEGWCVECGEALCVECVSAHRRVRMTRDHTIQTQITSSGFARKRYCSIHKDEPYKLFCLTCSKLTCRDCQLTLHRNHSFQFVAEVVSERRQRLEALVHKVKEQRAYTQRCLQDLEGRQLDLEDVLEGFKEDVKQALTEIRDLLVQSAMKIMSDAKVLYTSEIDRLKVRQAALQKLQERQAYLLAFSEKTLDSVDQGVLLSCANQVQQQLQALLTQTPPPCASMVHISLHLNKMAVRESLRHFGKVSWHVIPFACSKKLRIPKKVKETHPPPAQALPLDTPNAPCLSGPVEGSAVPPLSTRGSSVSSPLKAMAESTTSSPDCSEGTPALHSAMSMECEPSSTVPDSVGKPTPCWLESPLQVDLPVVTTTASVELSWGKPAGVAEVSTAAPSRSSPTQPPSTSESTFSLGEDPASEVTSVVVMQECPINGNAEASPVEASASCATSETDCFTKTASEAVETGHLQGAETGSPKKLVLRLHPPHIQTDTEHVQGVESASPKIVNVQGAESECVTSEHVQGAELGTLRIVNVQGAEPGTPRIVNVQGAEPGTPRIVDVQGAEPELAQEAEFEGKKTEHVQEVASDFVITEHMQEAESDCRETERVQEAESDCRETERVQEAESECRETECVQEAESECRETERVQEAESDCRETERLQEAESDCRETERLQEAESNCRETEHVQEVVSDFVATEHVQTAPPDVSVCPDVGQSSVAPSRLRPPPHSPQTHSQEGPMLQSFLKALKLTVVRNPQLLSNPMFSASQGPDAAGRGADPVSSYCCPLEDDDFDDEDECVDVEMQDEEIYQLLPKKHWLPQVSVYQMTLPSASIGQPPPQFRLLQGESSMEFLIQEISEDDESAVCKAPASLAVPVQRRRCVACRVEGALHHCTACKRGYHKGCHIPPLVTRPRQGWVCGLCLDVSVVSLQGTFEGGFCMSAQDQKRCEYVLLSLCCSKYRPALFMTNQLPSSCSSAVTNIPFIRGRLLQKLPPPYRTPTEFVSDIWILLDLLLKRAKWKAEWEKQLKALRVIFSQRLQRAFSHTLHPSVLRNPFRQRPGRTRGTDRGKERGTERGTERGKERGTERGKERVAERGKERGADRGKERGMERGVERGKERGMERGKERAVEKGKERGIERGADRGLERRKERGAERGKERGADRGKERGMERGKERAVEKGKERGIERGADRGLERRKERGVERGKERGAERGKERGADRGMERGAERGKERGMDRGKERGAERGKERGGGKARRRKKQKKQRAGRTEGERTQAQKQSESQKQTMQSGEADSARASGSSPVLQVTLLENFTSLVQMSAVMRLQTHT